MERAKIAMSEHLLYCESVDLDVVRSFLSTRNAVPSRRTELETGITRTSLFAETSFSQNGNGLPQDVRRGRSLSAEFEAAGENSMPGCDRSPVKS